jgi:hypothetical protein
MCQSQAMCCLCDTSMQCHQPRDPFAHICCIAEHISSIIFLLFYWLDLSQRSGLVNGQGSANRCFSTYVHYFVLSLVFISPFDAWNGNVEASFASQCAHAIASSSICASTRSSSIVQIKTKLPPVFDILKRHFASTLEPLLDERTSLYELGQIFGAQYTPKSLYS